ncbi:PREDICTED: uncharacterized protein LOC104822874 [Tarenaya hassleriana]|uniref:uncharacterized protein LOC104822874 n=1 Tax=Tarenaya hassleriana TaxID=28532 RepID=UPI00053C0FB9|nr:PREDICTED: uncharacterized protein LOC104822874 [Tarenaya hassleriana]
MDPPYWVEKDHWDRMVEHWASPAAKEKSQRASQSRKAEMVPNAGGHVHTSGAKPFSRVMHEMAKKSEAPTFVDLLRATHTRKDGVMVDGKAQQIAEQIQHEIIASQTTQGETSASEPNLPKEKIDEIYLQVVPPNKFGRIYGLGSMQTDITYHSGEDAPSTAQETLSLARRVRQLEEQQAELLRQQAEFLRRQEEDRKLIEELRVQAEFFNEFQTRGFPSFGSGGQGSGGGGGGDGDEANYDGENQN